MIIILLILAFIMGVLVGIKMADKEYFNNNDMYYKNGKYYKKIYKKVYEEIK